ncbi:uncharacterized protein LOC122624512 [Drosophila teissieri]|uniref:uncharacterized protein LOC122624512 n=1 Tax=Drosophila teissieri TaxID=7243 RepID=UPI001CBA2EE4|nr:uncharacterized protein LOC122624512 [Drosophila teissieri]
MSSQLMGNLPVYRVTADYSFQNTGIDYAGQFQIRCSKGRDKFLEALRRFFARRGKSENIYSDNGTNFVGASRVLDKEFVAAIENNNELAPTLEKEGIKWHFIPPGSPHMGGLWEAGVISVKYHLKRVIGENSFTYEEFASLLCQIEAVLNSRPLVTVRSENDGEEILTPGHFLVGRPLIGAPEHFDESVKSVEGERLVLTNVHRSDMGGYNCIASNGIPPSVSKRFNVYVNFSPTIKAISQLVGAPVEREVTLECIVEVYPKPLNGWYHREGNIKMHNGNKYNISEEMINLYTWHLNLTIRHLTKSDFGTYSCSSVNALGKSESLIRLQELRLPPKLTTTPTPHMQTTGKSRRKHPASHKKGLNEVLRFQETHITNQIQQENEEHNEGIDMLKFTNMENSNGVLESDNINSMINREEVNIHQPKQYGQEKTKKPSGTIPSPSTPWIFTNTGSPWPARTSNATVALVISFWLLFWCVSLFSLKCKKSYSPSCCFQKKIIC